MSDWLTALEDAAIDAVFAARLGGTAVGQKALGSVRVRYWPRNDRFTYHANAVHVTRDWLLHLAQHAAAERIPALSR